MIRAVLDTNTLVSGLGWRESVPGRIWSLAAAGRFVLVTSPALLDELERVLAYPKLRSVFGTAARRARILELVRTSALVVEPDFALDVIERDPDDNRVLEAALAASAHFVVTGDDDLLELGEYENVRLVSPTQFSREVSE